MDVKTTKYLIFDFDGVLADTYASSVEVVAEIDGITEEKAVERQQVYASKSPHTRELNPSKEYLDGVQRWLDKFSSLLSAKGFELFQDFIDAIKQLPETKLAIVSNGSGSYIKEKLKDCELQFTHVLAFEDAYSKEDKVEMVCKDWGVEVCEAYYFTDTIGDVLELMNLMASGKIYGCAWGYQGYEKLLTVLHEENILKAPADILKI